MNKVKEERSMYRRREEKEFEVKEEGRSEMKKNYVQKSKKGGEKKKGPRSAGRRN